MLLPDLAERPDRRGLPQLGDRGGSSTAFGGLLVVDEAYAPFAQEDAVGLLARTSSELVVVRTLSKAYALAGIRVGYALADPEVIGSWTACATATT
jgi:histidinol-phosphate/aromatic aminotransferase/cobyric acid decarboxylase-like protein